MNQLLDLDLIEAPLFSWSKCSWLSLAILTISFLALTFTWQTFQKKQAEYDNLQLDLSLLNRQEQKNLHLKPINQVVTVSPKKLIELQEAVAILGMPWSTLFMAIEQADNKDIALLGLEPNSQKQQVLITGQAKNLQVVLSYIEQLEEQPNLKNVFLQKHLVDEVNPFKPVSFVVFSNWEMAQ